MNCPKCNGGAYVSEEELIQVLESVTPIKVIIKQTHICRSCGERFTRVAYEDLEAKKKEVAWAPAPGMPTSPEAAGPLPPEEPERLRFLDRI